MSSQFVALEGRWLTNSQSCYEVDIGLYQGATPRQEAYKKIATVVFYKSYPAGYINFSERPRWGEESKYHKFSSEIKKVVYQHLKDRQINLRYF